MYCIINHYIFCFNVLFIYLIEIHLDGSFAYQIEEPKMHYQSSKSLSLSLLRCMRRIDELAREL
jgi:hypothetical protein